MVETLQKINNGYLFKKRPRYLRSDEIDKMSPRDQTFLLNLMETGKGSETKHGKTREAEIETSVFATCTILENYPRHRILDYLSQSWNYTRMNNFMRLQCVC
jgi:MoxR-like ATPase